MSLHSRPRYTNTLRATALAAVLLAGASLVQAQQPVDKQITSLMAEKKWNEALTLIDGQLKSRPNDAQLMMNRGTVLSSMGRSADALAVFQKVATNFPQLPAAHNNMAVILAANGKYEEARLALEKAIQTHPAYATAYENLGDLYSYMAGDAYRKALQYDKNLKSAKPKLEMLGDLSALTAGGSPTPTPTPAPTTLASVDKPSIAASAATAAPPRMAQAPASSAAAKPEPTPAATAKPAPTPAAPTATAVEDALQAWANAWSKRDMKAYAASYTPDFKGSRASHSEWLKARTAVIVPRKNIDVKVSSVRVNINGDSAEVSFQQDYSSDGHNVNTRKSIEMQKINDKWLIRKESGR